MSKSNKNKFTSFISSKGFYVAVAVCLAGAGVATWLAVDRTISGIEDQNSKIIENEAKYQEFPPLEEAVKKQTDIPANSRSASSDAQKPSSSSSTSQAQSSEASSSSTQPSKPNAQSEQSQTSQPSVKLSYTLPVSGDIINAFSNGELVRNVTLGDWRTHNGTDIRCDVGTDILASAEGKIIDIKEDSLWGNIVTIEHPDGKQTIYSGLAKNLPVAVGDVVAAKQVIGTLDGVPCESSDTMHLHFAAKENGKWIDPLTLNSSSAS